MQQYLNETLKIKQHFNLAAENSLQSLKSERSFEAQSALIIQLEAHDDQRCYRWLPVVGINQEKSSLRLQSTKSA